MNFPFRRHSVDTVSNEQSTFDKLSRLDIGNDRKFHNFSLSRHGSLILSQKDADYIRSRSLSPPAIALTYSPPNYLARLPLEEEVLHKKSTISPAFTTITSTTLLSVNTTLSGVSSTNAPYGTKVSETHKNFVLMYDMLTGIRISVSRNQAKPTKRLNDADFRASNKLAFDLVGNELTPSSKYDFKFKDYSPWVFREIRDLFRIDPAEYLISLTNKYVLSERGSPGKSGSFFYYSQDYRFIIKTIRHSEHIFLRKLLVRYYDHIRRHPNTLISRILGLHRVKLPGSKKIHFVVMGNIFSPTKDIHEIYDLKGSTLGRMVTSEEIRENSRAVRKDLNWIQSGHRLYLGPDKRLAFLDQLTIDVKFLKSLDIMDYSLLVGIHYISRGNYERQHGMTGLTIVEPRSESSIQNSPAILRDKSFISKENDERIPEDLGIPTFTDELPSERKNFKFYQEDGGFRSSFENNKTGNELYFLGIIDILTPYSIPKKFEHIVKSLNYDKNAISAVEPSEYGKRFMAFMRKYVVGVNDAGTLLIRNYMKDLPIPNGN